MADKPSRPEKPRKPAGQGNGGSGNGPAGSGKPGGPGTPGLKFGRGIFLWVIFIIGVVLVFLTMSTNRDTAATVPYSQFKGELAADNVQSVTITNEQVSGEYRHPVAGTSDGTDIKKFRFPLLANQVDGAFINQIAEAKGRPEVKLEHSNDFLMQFLITLIPWLLIFGFIWFFVIRQLKSSGGAGGMLGNFGRSKHRITSKEHTNITFDDVAGVQEAKDEVSEIVEFLKNPKKFQRLGGRIPRGVLLVGEPGTGKTLLAKAIAGEADAPFFSISGSDFVEMFVGVGASRVRDLFKQAKDNSPCIIFLDEIDAVGRRRGSGFSSGGHDEREQTLNAILVEMDGFETNDQVIVVASTNRVDVLDPALTRPGRFDRQVTVPLPDVKGRMEILKVHARKVKIGPNVDLSRLAKATPGFSGADLAAIINEAALMATLAGKDFIEQEDLEESRDKVRFGRAKKSRVMDEKDKLATAYHEAGHTVVQYLNKDADPLHKVTIIPRGPYGGATMSLPEKDRNNYSKKWCIATMRTCFGGRIAEEMFCGDVNTGAIGDIRQASSIARKMVTEWGMSDRLGFVYYGDDENRPSFMDMGHKSEYSEQTAKVIDEEIKHLIDRLYDETRQFLEGRREQVDAIAKALMKYETLDTDDIDRLMRGDNLTKPTVSDLLEQEKAKRPPTIIAPPPEGEASDVQLGGGALPSPG